MDRPPCRGGGSPSRLATGGRSMSRRRSFGAVRKLNSGRWQARYRNATTGKTHTAPRTFKTKSEAGIWLATIQADMTRGVWLDPAAGEMTFAELSERWL